jgi:hypothetical protein
MKMQPTRKVLIPSALRTGAALGLAIVASAGAVFAQSATVTMRCRDLVSTGNYVAQDETIVNGMACKPVASTAPAGPAGVVTVAAAVPSDKPVAAPAAAPVAAPVTVIPSGPVSTTVAPGSRVYIAPMGGFETYLAAAFQKKHVQVVPVASEEQSQYVLSGTSEEKKAGWAKMAFMGSYHSDDAASVSLVDRKTGAIVFAYAVNKKNTMHGNQTTAEACAKHLQDHIEGKE